MNETPRKMDSVVFFLVLQMPSPGEGIAQIKNNVAA